MDTAVEVAWPGRYDRALPMMIHPALPHILLRAHNFEPNFFGRHF
jgi:hypothetical protein